MAQQNRGAPRLPPLSRENRNRPPSLPPQTRALAHHPHQAWDAYGQHNTGIFMEEAKHVVDNHDPATPMFMYFAHQEVHAPLELTPDNASRVACVGENVPSSISDEATAGRHTLCTMASNVDSAIGAFVDMLKQKAMWENTLLWLTTDNGGMTYVGRRAVRSRLIST